MGFYDCVHTAPAPKAEAHQQRVRADARKRFSNNWQFLASYVWSQARRQLRRHVPGSTGQLDPNINSAFDYADFLVNADGQLSNDRDAPAQVRRQLRVLEGRADGPEPRPVDALVLRPAAERVRLLVRVSELGVLPRAARLARPRTDATGKRTCRRVSDQVRRHDAAEL